MVHFLYYLKHALFGIFNEEVMDCFFYNLVIWYYTIFAKRKRGIANRKNNRKVIVSLTTIPNRIESVWVTVESLLRQSYKPNEIILWLGKEEFQGIDIPYELQKQVARGLSIKYCKDIKSYKKIIYTAKQYPNAYIVTVDDDIIYSEKLLKTLLKEYKKNKGCIICTRSHVIKQRNGKILPYYKWGKYENREKSGEIPSYSNFFTSGAGTLIPAFSMNEVMLKEEVFMQLSPTADDVWLNFVAWISGVKTVNVNGILGNFISNRESADNGLYIENVIKQKNDVQIKKVIKYLEINVAEFLGK